MNQFMIAMMLKGLVFSLIVYFFYLVIPKGRIKTALFRERPWNLPAWIVSMSLFWLILYYAIAGY